MTEENELKLINIFESIANSLSTIAVDTKANRELREENRELFSELDRKLTDLAKNPFGS